VRARLILPDPSARIAALARLLAHCLVWVCLVSILSCCSAALSSPAIQGAHAWPTSPVATAGTPDAAMGAGAVLVMAAAAQTMPKFACLWICQRCPNCTTSPNHNRAGLAVLGGNVQAWEQRLSALPADPLHSPDSYHGRNGQGPSSAAADCGSFSAWRAQRGSFHCAGASLGVCRSGWTWPGLSLAPVVLVGVSVAVWRGVNLLSGCCHVARLVGGVCILSVSRPTRNSFPQSRNHKLTVRSFRPTP
jgi:hypothetical protein